MQRYWDGAGNLTVDNYTGGGTRAYDAENRITSAQFLAGQTQTASYVYDGDGRRVKRNVGTAAEVWQVYGVGGELLAEYARGTQPNSPKKEYGYRGGELLVTAAATTTQAVAPVNLAQGKATSQSSTLTGFNPSSDSWRAVDGNTNGGYFSGSVTHTNGESNPWWQVDLRYYVGYLITRAYYENAKDKLRAVHDILHIQDARTFYEASGVRRKTVRGPVRG